MTQSYKWQLFVTPGLGDNTYLLQSGREAVLIDPQRDAWRFLRKADSEKLRIRYVLETHVHNDYVSGALEIRSATGAEVAAPANGKYEFPHREAADGDEIRIGVLRLVAMETPGHTPEHISWLLYQDGFADPLAVFSGGSLLVGGAGRTDLLGPHWTRALTDLQFETMQKLAALPRSISLLPTHGAGSFCSAAGNGGDRISTLEIELQSNPALQHRDKSSFAEHQLRNLNQYPAYYSHIAPINRKGPRILAGVPQLAGLSSAEFSAQIASGCWIIDGRNRKSFAMSHIPGSLNIELGDDYATYAGWLIPFAAPVVLVLPDPQQESLEEAVTQLIRIGYDNLHGYLNGGYATWESSGSETSAYPTGTLDELCVEYNAGKRNLIDVRQKREWDEGHAEGSIHGFIGDLPAEIGELPRKQELWVACASGFRAAIAASYLNAAGISVRLLADAGISDLLKSCPMANAKPV